MPNIRKAQAEDLGRIAEIEVFNYRLNFFPIFKSEWFYFVELTVENVAKRYENMLDDIWVYEDAAVQGFMMKKDDEIVKLFVEPALQNNGVGAKLLDFAKQQGGKFLWALAKQQGGKFLWALEKNTGAIRFYQRHGFKLTGEKKFEEDTIEYLVKMKL